MTPQNDNAAPGITVPGAALSFCELLKRVA
jgi:hypothetical protein